METDVELDVKFDGTNWYMNILGKSGGPHMTKDTADVILWWFHAGGLQWMNDVYCDIIEQAFSEKEIRQNGK